MLCLSCSTCCAQPSYNICRKRMLNVQKLAACISLWPMTRYLQREMGNNRLNRQLCHRSGVCMAGPEHVCNTRPLACCRTLGQTHVSKPHWNLIATRVC